MTPSLSEVLNLWRTERLANGLSAKYIENQLGVVRAAASALRCDPTAFGHDQIVAYLASFEAATTRRMYFEALDMWHRWLESKRIRPDNPMADLPRPRVPKGLPRPATFNQIAKVLASGRCRPRTQMMILMASRHGQRIHEVVAANGRDIDRVERTILIHGKGNKQILAPLDAQVLALAERWPVLFPIEGLWFPSPKFRGRHISPSAGSKVVSAAFRRLGMPVTAHQLRHWVGSTLIELDVPTRIVQEVLRHSRITDTELYTNVVLTQRRRALAKLPPFAIPGLPRDVGALPPPPLPPANLPVSAACDPPQVQCWRDRDGGLVINVKPEGLLIPPQLEGLDISPQDRLIWVLHEAGASWAVIADAVGLSVRGAQQELTAITTKRRRNPRPSCEVEGCLRPYCAKGLCTAHYGRKRAGKALDEPPLPGRPTRPCHVHGCIREIYAIGLCRAHYQSERRHGRPSEAE